MLPIMREVLLVILFLDVVLGCGQVFTHDFDLIAKQPTVQTGKGRLLLNRYAHPLKIYGHYVNSQDGEGNLSVIQTLFGIATSYYSRVIKVHRLHHNDTIYPEIQAKCGSVQVPKQYEVDGFDQNQIDMVLFVQLKNQLTDYVAAAAPCVMVRRPVYGILLFNMQYVDKYETSGQFHNYIMVTIHEIVHVLGMRPQLFQHFYESPTSNIRKPINEVIKNISSRSYIITPRVKKYVNNYFGCDEEIGALLQEEGGEGSMLRHWERKVFMDDIMTASNLVQGLRLTELTLNLLADSNFYASVDVSASDKAFWGKDKGCEFAQGLDNSYPEYSRQVNIQKCDYYHKFSGYSTNIDQFGSKAIYTWPFLNMLCGYPSDEPFQAIALGYYHKKSVNARCFEILYSKDANHYLSVCYEAYCNDTGIVISVGKEKGVCKNQSQSVKINGISIRCPQSFDAFCGHKVCPQWCSKKGLCLNGKCICNPPFFGENCSESCVNYYELETGNCVNNCKRNQVLFENTTCLNVCPYLLENKNGECKNKQLTTQKGQALLKMWVVLALLSILLL